MRASSLPRGAPLFLLVALIVGCASPVARRDPIAALADRALTTRTRSAAPKEALAKVRAGELDPDAFREALKSAVWRRGEPASVRLAAIDALAEHDPEDTRRMLALLLPTETAWPVIERISTMAGERGWTDLTPALVRSWSRPVAEPPDDARPERAALVALHPDRPLQNVVFDVFAAPADPDDLFGERRRADAWALLQRIDPGGRFTQRLVADLPPDEAPDDPVLADLIAAARDFGATPANAEQLQWLRDLRRPDQGDLWTLAADAAKRLPPEARATIQLRHIPALAWTLDHRPDWLSLSRSELLSRARAGLSGVRRHRRTEGYADLMAAPRETLDAFADDMAWGDFLLVLIAMETIDRPKLVDFLFNHAERDRGDNSTELGGAIIDPQRAQSGASAHGDDEIAAIAYDPRPAQRRGDHRFVASSELLDAAAPALFHYHFHAQRYDNDHYAGPGRGDMQYAERFGRACLVFTFITADILAADYYQPGGVRLDLGEVRRDH